jgi:hypothetical protein
MLDPLDTIAIHQLLALYGHLADEAKFRPIAAEEQQRLDVIFTADATFDARPMGRNLLEGLDAIRTMFAEGKPAHTPSHQSTNVYVYESDGVVRARSKWHMIDWSGNVWVGEYNDVLVRSPDGWRINERVVVRSGGTTQSALA